MWLPLLRVLLEEPALLIGHASGYAALIQQETANWQTLLKQHIHFLLLLVVCGSLALLLGAIALMLYAVTATSHWLLYAIPMAPMLGVIVAIWGLSRRRPMTPTFPRVRAQIDRDLQLFGQKVAGK